MIRLVSCAFIMRVVYVNRWAWVLLVLSPLTMVPESGSVCVSICFWVGILRNVPTSELACFDTNLRKPLVGNSTMSSPVLLTKLLTACSPWDEQGLWAWGTQLLLGFCLSLWTSCCCFVHLIGKTFWNGNRPIYPLAYLNTGRLIQWLFKVRAVSRTDA